MRRFLLLILVFLISVPVCHAQQDGFASNSDDILRMLTSPGGRAFLKIEFNVNSAEISGTALPVVDSLGTALTSGSAASMNVKLVGHTDSAGAAGYNRELSLKRAASVKDYLCNHFSIDSGRIQVEGLGEEQPIASNDTSAGRALNRRVEVINITPEAQDKSVEPEGGVPVLDTEKLW